MNKLQYEFRVINYFEISLTIEFIQTKNVEFSILISFYFFVASVLERQPESRPIKNLYSLQSLWAQSQVDATESARSFFFFSFTSVYARAGWNPNEFTNLGCTLAWNLCLIHKRYVPARPFVFLRTGNIDRLPLPFKRCLLSRNTVTFHVGPRFLVTFHFTHRMIFF